MMAKGGNSQKSNGSRFSKPYDVSNSFVTKVASRVSDYLGGWFGSSRKSNVSQAPSVGTLYNQGSRRPYENYEVKRSSGHPHTYLHVDDDESTNSPAKRFKLAQTEKSSIDFPLSPIPSTSGLFSSTAVNHASFELPKTNVDYVTSDPGPSSLASQRYSQANNVVSPSSGTTSSDVKANGNTDNHSDSSESTSGCSSLVPQSDRLSQSAYVCSSKKRTLEEKLKYARQLQQSRTSMFLNRSIPVGEVSGGRKKPSFDVTAYNSTSLDKSLLREKLINSPFYTGQTSYGGASAYRLSRNTFYSQRNARNSSAERREGVNIEVKPSHHGSTESLTNMSHTAKKILEALEQFSTPVSDAKRIPTNKLTPLGAKRKRLEELSESRMRLAAPISPLNPKPGPITTGLNVPTVPDLLKLKRLERIQNSTAAARQVVAEKQEYTLPSDVAPAKRTGKIVTKLKDKEKNVQMEKLEEVNLPKIPLPITTLPKFDFQLPPIATQSQSQSQPFPTIKSQPGNVKNRTFKFSDPIIVSMNTQFERPARKNSFLFSDPLNADDNKKVKSLPGVTTIVTATTTTTVTTTVGKEVTSSLMNFMSSEAVAKLKRKSINDSSDHKNASSAVLVPAVPAELKTGSVMDFFKKSAEETKSPGKVSSGTWECDGCLIRNLNDSKICCGCKAVKVSKNTERTSLNLSKEKTVTEEPAKPQLTSGFGDKFKPPAGSWSCKECFVSNKESATKCVACETPKPSASSKAVDPPNVPKPTPASSGFGDLFKKQANQWDCSVCMIRNKESDLKCVACETPKPGAKPAKSEPKFNFGTTPSTGGFLFGIDKAGVKSAADSSTFKIQQNGPAATTTTASTSTGLSQFKPISTSVGVFTFGIPPASQQEQKEQPSKVDTKPPTDSSSNRFMVTSTSGTGTRKDESLCEISKSEEKKDNSEVKNDKNEVSVTDSSKVGNECFKPFVFGASNKASTSSFVFGQSKEENKEKVVSEPEKKPSTFFFGGNANSLETVSSSTTDFSFKTTKPTTTQQDGGDSGFPKPATTFQFKPFGSTDTTTPKPSVTVPTISLDANEAEVKSATSSSTVSTSSTVTTSTPVFGSVSLFNSSNSKMSFGTTSASGLGFSQGSLTTSNTATPFSMPAQPFGASGFGSQSLSAPAAPASTPASAPASAVMPAPSLAPAPAPAPAFGIVPPAAEKPTVPVPSSFGGSTTGTFGIIPNSFAPTLPSSNSEPPKSFGSLGSATTVPAFGASPTPAFGSSFMQPSVPAEKPVNQPFIFGSSQSSATTTTSTPTPGVFTFGASKPAPFAFGQSSSSNFNFGSNAATTNFFGGFGQPKPNEPPAGGMTSVFGNPTPMFGQGSAPAAFGESTAPKFEFGVPTPQQQPQSATPGVFQFGAPPAQPASAPPGTGFSLSIPQKFDFTGGQVPEFSARPELPEVRKVIKAVRRTKPKRP